MQYVAADKSYATEKLENYAKTLAETLVFLLKF